MPKSNAVSNWFLVARFLMLISVNLSIAYNVLDINKFASVILVFKLLLVWNIIYHRNQSIGRFFCINSIAVFNQFIKHIVFTTSILTKLLSLLKSFLTALNLSISNLSTLALRLAQLAFLVNFYISTADTFLRKILFNLINLIQLLFFLYYDYLALEKDSFYITISFLSIQLLSELSWSFRLIYDLPPFVFIILSTLNSVWFAFFQLFFIKHLYNCFFSMKDFCCICPWQSTFDISNNKNTSWSVPFCKNSFIFWYYHAIFKFRIVIIIFNFKVNICTQLYVLDLTSIASCWLFYDIIFLFL